MIRPALCACLLTVAGAGLPRTLAAAGGSTRESADPAQPADSWQQELKGMLHDLRDEAYNAMHLGPSPVLRKLLWANASAERRRIHQFLKVSPEQKKLIEDLDRVARESLNLSFLRDIDFLASCKRRPPQLDRRLKESETKRKAIASSADRIALFGILDPEQAELVKRMAWRSNRLGALQDDELAARLRLDREQRREIARRLAELAQVQAQPAPLRPVTKSSSADEIEAANRAYREQASRMDAAAQSVWNVLDPSQVERWDRLMEPLARMDAQHHPGH